MKKKNVRNKRLDIVLGFFLLVSFKNANYYFFYHSNNS